jgi:hypothetical protein
MKLLRLEEQLSAPSSALVFLVIAAEDGGLSNRLNTNAII